MSRAVTDIQADLTIAYSARKKALEAESYTQDSGQGRITVTRSLENINRTIRTLEDELENAVDPYGGIIAPTFDRGIL